MNMNAYLMHITKLYSDIAVTPALNGKSANQQNQGAIAMTDISSPSTNSMVKK